MIVKTYHLYGSKGTSRLNTRTLTQDRQALYRVSHTTESDQDMESRNDLRFVCLFFRPSLVRRFLR